jgi:hypothetical protein
MIWPYGISKALFYKRAGETLRALPTLSVTELSYWSSKAHAGKLWQVPLRGHELTRGARHEPDNG